MMIMILIILTVVIVVIVMIMIMVIRVPSEYSLLVIMMMIAVIVVIVMIMDIGQDALLVLPHGHDNDHDDHDCGDYLDNDQRSGWHPSSPPPNYERIIERNLDVDDVCQLPFLPLSAFQPLSGDLVQALSLFIEKFQ